MSDHAGQLSRSSCAAAQFVALRCNPPPPSPLPCCAPCKADPRVLLRALHRTAPIVGWTLLAAAGVTAYVQLLQAKPGWPDLSRPVAGAASCPAGRLACMPCSHLKRPAREGSGPRPLLAALSTLLPSLPCAEPTPRPMLPLRLQACLLHRRRAHLVCPLPAAGVPHQRGLRPLGRDAHRVRPHAGAPARAAAPGAGGLACLFGFKIYLTAADLQHRPQEAAWGWGEPPFRI